MDKLVRRKGKLLRKGGKLTRSPIDLNPAPPCECCPPPPPPPPPPGGSWLCDAHTGLCVHSDVDGSGYATEALCLANCHEAVTSYNCIDDPTPCVGLVGGHGTYLTLAECLAHCIFAGNPF